MDRNTQRRDFKALGLPSLSARRAWIEMHCVEEVSGDTWVALRKESVDRNCICVIQLIERRVALRKESVDRNDVSLNYKEVLYSRSPQGERG